VYAENDPINRVDSDGLGPTWNGFKSVVPDWAMKLARKFDKRVDKVQDKIEKAEKATEVAIELNEALHEPEKPRQAAAILRTCLSWLPQRVQMLFPSDVAVKAMDQGIKSTDYRSDYLQQTQAVFDDLEKH